MHLLCRLLHNVVKPREYFGRVFEPTGDRAEEGRSDNDARVEAMFRCR